MWTWQCSCKQYHPFWHVWIFSGIFSIADGVLEYTESSAWRSFESMELNEDINRKMRTPVFPYTHDFVTLQAMQWLSLLYLLLNWDETADIKKLNSSFNAGKTVTSPKYNYKLHCSVDRATVWTQSMTDKVLCYLCYSVTLRTSICLLV